MRVREIDALPVAKTGGADQHLPSPAVNVAAIGLGPFLCDQIHRQKRTEPGLDVTEKPILPVDGPPYRLGARRYTRLREVALTLIYFYPRRTLAGFALMAAQAFFYNAIFFTYALVLTEFYHIPSDQAGLYILPFAAGNFLGPIVLGRLFDTIGRRPMIAFTYAMSGLLLAPSGALFAMDAISAVEQTIAWMAIFFFASPAQREQTVLDPGRFAPADCAVRSPLIVLVRGHSSSSLSLTRLQGSLSYMALRPSECSFRGA